MCSCSVHWRVCMLWNVRNAKYCRWKAHRTFKVQILGMRSHSKLYICCKRFDCHVLSDSLLHTFARPARVYTIRRMWYNKSSDGVFCCPSEMKRSDCFSIFNTGFRAARFWTWYCKGLRSRGCCATRVYIGVFLCCEIRRYVVFSPVTDTSAALKD